MRSKLTKKMDYLNHHLQVSIYISMDAIFLNPNLQLDLVVRDSEANILDPGRSSAVTLYREHKLSSDNRSRHPAAFSSRSNSYMLLLSVKNFTWKRSEDMELFISVYTTGGRDGSTEPRFHDNDLAFFAIRLSPGPRNHCARTTSSSGPDRAWRAILTSLTISRLVNFSYQ